MLLLLIPGVGMGGSPGVDLPPPSPAPIPSAPIVSVNAPSIDRHASQETQRQQRYVNRLLGPDPSGLEGTVQVSILAPGALGQILQTVRINVVEEGDETLNWTAPGNIVSPVYVELWGGGGCGAATNTNGDGGGGGGGGGAYAAADIAVVAGTPYVIAVGVGGTENADGGASSFNTTDVVAAGGKHASSESGAAGGAVVDCTGTVKYKGGDGGSNAGAFNGADGGGGGGGGSGAPASAGNNGSDTSNDVGGDGATAITDGGGGGRGGDFSGAGNGNETNSTAGSEPGGGGGGGGDGTASPGAKGKYRLTYDVTDLIVDWGGVGGTVSLASGKVWLGDSAGVAQEVTPTGDVTITNVGVTAIGANKVTNTMIRDSVGLSVIGRSANSTGDPDDIAAGTDGHVLRRSGTTIGFGTVATAGIADGAITEAKQTLVDNTTGNVSSSAHGYVPKSPADATKFLNGAATPAYALVKDSDLSTSDITTNDVSSSKHGFYPKLGSLTTVSAYLGSDQTSLTQNAWTTLHIDTEVTDVLSEFNTSTYTFTPATTGTYWITIRATIGSSSGRNILSLWTGTSSEHTRFFDGTAIMPAGTYAVDLTASTGYTFRVFPTDAGTTALHGAGITEIKIYRRL